jgi:hypothetical protein
VEFDMTSSTLKATVAVIALTAGSAFAQSTDTDTSVSTDTDSSASATTSVVPTDETTAPSQVESDTETADVDTEADSADMAAENSDVAPSVDETAETEMDTDVSTDVAEDNAQDDPAATAMAEADASSDTEMADGDVLAGETDEASADANATAMTDADVASDSASDSGMVDNFAGMIASDIVGMNVVQADGEDIGEVDSIVRDNGALAAVVGIGGFLGLGEHSVAVPLSELSRGEDGQLMLTTLTKAELDAQAEVDDDAVEQLEGEEPLDAAS